MTTEVLDQAARDLIASRIRDIPDFPTPGVIYKDITPLLADPKAFEQAVSFFASIAQAEEVSYIVGMEARGFLLGTPAALTAGIGFIPLRKSGKLPGDTLAQSYALEYGEATLEIQVGAITPGTRVLVVDDVLATGGTAKATCELVERAGATVAGLAFLLDLAFLNGRSRLAPYRVDSLIVVE